jgi:hypothetical protein
MLTMPLDEMRADKLDHYCGYTDTQFTEEDDFKFKNRPESKRFHLREVFSGLVIGRSTVHINQVDEWQVTPYLQGDPGSGKGLVTKILRGILGPHVQELQSGQYADKFILNPKLAKKSLVIAGDQKESCLQAEQLQKMVSGEHVATRGMHQEADEKQWFTSMLFIANVDPSWEDAMGEIARRLMLFRFEKVQGADADMGKKLASERAAILTYCLRCYGELAEHIKTTPKQEWCYGYFTENEADAEANKFPLLKMLEQGQFMLLGATYTLTYAEGSVTTVPELQSAFDAFMESKQKSKQTIQEGALKHVLECASRGLTHGQKFLYCRKEDYYKCQDCGVDVDTQTASASACKPACSNQCPPRCYVAPLKAHYLDTHKVKKSSRTITPKTIKHLRITTDAGSTVPGAGGASVASGGQRA